MNVLSLFDGMSCGRIALDRAGIKVDKYYASEIDKYAIQVAAANYPDTIHLGDVTKWREWDLSSIDMILAGSPCQGLSFAGKMLGLKDDRSKLFYVFVDILKHLKEKNPALIFLLENVIMGQESNDVISCILGDIYPGHVSQKQLFQNGRLEPIQINSALVSAQNRKRLYWTNIKGVEQPEDKGILLEDILECGSNTVNQRGRGNNPGGDRADKSPCMGANAWHQNVKVRKKSKTVRCGGRSTQPGSKQEWDGVYELAKKIQDGNPRVDGVSITKDGLRPFKDDGHQVSLSEFGVLAFPDCKSATHTAGHPPKVIIGGPRGKHFHVKADRKHRLKKDQSKASCLSVGGKGCGNYSDMDMIGCIEVGTAKDVKGWDILKRVYSTKGKSPTIESNSGGPRQKKIAVDACHWRKLTCIECERLQTVPDNYTDHVSNSQRYKMLGNGWTVDVIVHILKSKNKATGK